MTKEISHILVVDDVESIRVTLGEFIKEDGHEVETAGDARGALNLMDRNDYDVIISDIILPGMNGMELLKQIRMRSPDIQVIMITGEPTVDTASRAVRAGAFDYLCKPISRDEITRVVVKALQVKILKDEKRRLEKENLRYREHLEELVEERTHALRESEERYRTLVEGAGQPIFTLDSDGRFLFLNRVAADILGGKTGSVTGRSLADVLPELGAVGLIDH